MEQQLPTHNPIISIARVEELDYDLIFKMINIALNTIYDKSGVEVVDAMMDIVPGYTSEYAAIHYNQF